MLSWLFGKKLEFWGNVFFVYANPALAEQLWADKFDAKRVEVPENNDPLPSDTSLGAGDLCIMFSSLNEVQEAKLGRETDYRPTIECNDIDLRASISKTVALPQARPKRGACATSKSTTPRAMS